jgi:hypothetical protein
VAADRIRFAPKREKERGKEKDRFRFSIYFEASKRELGSLAKPASLKNFKSEA